MSKTRPFFIPLLVLLGLAVATASAFSLGRLLPGPRLRPVSATADPPLATLDLPAQTVNGITAQVESYYADANRLLFRVRVNGERDDYFLENIALREAREGDNYSSYGVSQVSDDPSAFLVDLVTAAPLEGKHLEGEFAFAVFSMQEEGTLLADFRFDLDLPVHPALTFRAQQTAAANGVEMLLDRVVMTPAFTYVYVCYSEPTSADWGISRDTTLQIGSQTGSLYDYSLLYGNEFAGGQGGEPGWTPPVQEGRCGKIGFQIGDADPKSLTLTIPALEQSLPEEIPADDLGAAYETLQAQGIDMEWHQLEQSAYPEYKKLPAGMTRAEAFRRFAHALGYVHPGEWVFEVTLDR